MFSFVFFFSSWWIRGERQKKKSLRKWPKSTFPCKNIVVCWFKINIVEIKKWIDHSAFLIYCVSNFIISFRCLVSGQCILNYSLLGVLSLFFCCCLLRKIHNTNEIIQLMIIRETAYQISFSLGLAVAKIFGSNSKGNNKANKMAELSWKRRQTTKTAAKQQSAKKV